MSKDFGIALRARTKLLLMATAGVAALGVLTTPRLSAQAPGQSLAAIGERPQFDAASIKSDKSGGAFCTSKPFSCYLNLGQPGLVTATNVTLRDLIAAAYGLTAVQTGLISGAPKWMNSERFDVEARAEDSPGLAQKRLMLQTLLADRFNLVVHHVMRQGPVYALVVVNAGKMGPRLVMHSDAAECIDLSAGQPAHPPALGDVFCGGFLVLNSRGVTHCTGNNVTMDGLAAQLGGDSDIGRTVVNQTGLRGTFDVTLEYTPPGAADADMSASDPSAPPSLLTALREQLGLKLESQRGQVDALAVDHVDQPSGN